MFNRRTMMAAAATMMTLTGAFAQDYKAKYPELTFAVVPAENASGVSERYAPFAAYLTKELGVKVSVKIANDYAAVIEGQRAGNIHIGYYGAASYSRAVITGVKTDAFAMDQNADGTTGYYSMFFVLAKSPFQKIEDMKGKNLGLVDPNSTSGNNVPRFELDKKGIKPDEFFGKVIFTGSHDNAILALAQGTVDVAANQWTADNDNTIVQLIGKGLLKNADGTPMKYTDFRSINKSSPILNGPYAYLDSLPEDLKAAIKKAWFDAPTKDKAAYDRLSDGLHPKFVPVTEKDYEPTMQLIKFVDSLRKK